jgi:transposase
MAKDDKEASTSELVDTSQAVGAKRRRWPEALVREMVAATQEPGSSVSIVARRYDVNANQLFKWRRRLGLASRRTCSEPMRLLPVEIAATPPAVTGSTAADGVAGGAGPPALAPATPPGSIEIELRRGRRVKISGSIDPAVVTAALRVLARR